MLLHFANHCCKAASQLLQSSLPTAAKQSANCCEAVCQLLRSSLPTAVKQLYPCCMIFCKHLLPGCKFGINIFSFHISRRNLG